MSVLGSDNLTDIQSHDERSEQQTGRKCLLVTILTLNPSLSSLAGLLLTQLVM